MKTQSKTKIKYTKIKIRGKLFFHLLFIYKIPFSQAWFLFFLKHSNVTLRPK